MTATTATFIPDEHLLNVAQIAANNATEVALHFFNNSLQVNYKADESPVTVADWEVENILRDVILEHFPDHGIFAEESGSSNLKQDIVWTIDPIDGTKSFITGMPLFGTLISALRDGVPTVGLIHMPALDKTFTGIRGGQAHHKGQVIRTRQCPTLDQAICFIGEGDKMLAQNLGLYENLTRSTRLTRFGYDCYSYAQLACGKIDIVIEQGLHPYDFCALVPVIEAAGGVITDWQGSPLSLDSGGEVLACGDPQLHAQALKLIERYQCDRQ
ncbi:inositol monophosphatase family protein [Aestuariispira ectoiniformans]|uniref:inositol monophosphatase family protein n=1 Tax=Aestuariispira ectoiniformans TaxID=2775080 RepID=UPI00223AE1B7|nr:inositol monophosphatase family protein [Aestuariispira ectoiniformans]